MRAKRAIWVRGKSHQMSYSWRYICPMAEFQMYILGMHRYHFFTNRYEYEYFYLCICRYRVPIPILLRFGLHESAINLEADFILSSADYVKPIVQNNRRLSQAKNKQSFLVLTHKKAFKQTIS